MVQVSSQHDELARSAGASSRPDWAQRVLVIAIVLCFCVPLIYLAVRNWSNPQEFLDALTSTAALQPLLRSIWLATCVTACSVVVAVSLSWLIVRTDLPGRHIWRITAPVPLILPSFVAATALLAAFGRGGLVSELIAPLGIDSTPNVRGFWGALFCLTVVSYPYVYLPVTARLASLPRANEEVALLLGASRFETFRHVVWPQLKGSVRAGALLVFLYSLSDFGVVALLDYPTLTVRIFSSRLADTPLAFALALLLAVTAIAITMAEQRRAPEATKTTVSQQSPSRLGAMRWPLTAGVAMSFVLTVIAPVTVLGWWVWRGLVNQSSGFADTRGSLLELWRPTVNTMGVGLATGVIAVAVTLPVAYFTTRGRNRLQRPIDTALVAGFAMPGLVVALAVLTMSLRIPLLRPLSDSLVLLVFAYVVHFGAQAYRSAKVGTATINPATVEAARTMGTTRWDRLRMVELPAMSGALRAGGGLVMLSTMKELPATLLLRPLGFDTLASRIWNAAGEGFLAEAGLASLILLATSASLSWVFVLRRPANL